MSASHDYEDRRKPEARQAKDVMAFGQEIGRVLSDGRIIGRAEPFAKVFPSSRTVKRAVGLVAWGILEDIALDARLDDRGRLVAETNVRRIATNLRVSKTTVQKHLAVLRDYGFVFHEELREAESGRYEQVRYVIDPSACIERFTTAPGPRTRPAGGGRVAPEDRRPLGDDRVPDPGTRSVSQFTGHGDLVQQTEEQEAVVEQTQQPRADAAGDCPRQDLVAALTTAGVAPGVAARLVDEQPAERIRDALAALAGKRLHNPAGWLVRAIAGGWDLSGDVEEARRARARAQGRQRDEATSLDRRRRERDRDACSAAWASALSAALDDTELDEAIGRLTRPVPGIGRRSAPGVCADLLRWAQAVAVTDPGRPFDVAVRSALAARPTPDDVPDVAADVAPPTPCPTAADLSARVAALLDRDRHRTASRGYELSL